MKPNTATIKFCHRCGKELEQIAHCNYANITNLWRCNNCNRLFRCVTALEEVPRNRETETILGNQNLVDKCEVELK
jgi:DNA-directed RNA polymerase subunit RPC12/RpoP